MLQPNDYFIQCYKNTKCVNSRVFFLIFEVELAIKTDENDIFIVLCYYFK